MQEEAIRVSVPEAATLSLAGAKIEALAGILYESLIARHIPAQDKEMVLLIIRDYAIMVSTIANDYSDEINEALSDKAECSEKGEQGPKLANTA
jgi:hypothetical protein